MKRRKRNPLYPYEYDNHLTAWKKQQEEPKMSTSIDLTEKKWNLHVVDYPDVKQKNLVIELEDDSIHIRFTHDQWNMILKELAKLER